MLPVFTASVFASLSYVIVCLNFLVYSYSCLSILSSISAFSVCLCFSLVLHFNSFLSLFFSLLCFPLVVHFAFIPFGCLILYFDVFSTAVFCPQIIFAILLCFVLRITGLLLFASRCFFYFTSANPLLSSCSFSFLFLLTDCFLSFHCFLLAPLQSLQNHEELRFQCGREICSNHGNTHALLPTMPANILLLCSLPKPLLL